MSIRSSIFHLARTIDVVHKLSAKNYSYKVLSNFSTRFPSVCGLCRSYSQSAVQKQNVEDELPEEFEASNSDSPDGDALIPVDEETPAEPQMWDRRVPTSLHEYKSLALRPPEQIVNPKYLRVSIIGSPNAGKSTLTNQILGWRVSSVSAKVHTTRRNTLAIMTDENVQIVLVDTPGAINKKHAAKHHLERSLLVDPEASLHTVDIVAVIVDASQPYSERSLDPLILQMLYTNPYLESILILNKVDRIKKKTKLLEMARVLTSGIVDSVPVPRHEPVESYLTKPQKAQLRMERLMGQRKEDTDPEGKFWDDVEKFGKMEGFEDKRRFISEKCGWPKFKEVFMVSALDGDGIDELKSYFVKSAYSAEWRFNPDLVSNQSPKEIVLMAVREKLLEHLRFHLPYQVELFLKEWQVDDRGTLRLTVKLKCPRKGDMKHVVGENGSRVREIAYEAGQEMMNTFRCEVLLKLIVAY